MGQGLGKNSPVVLSFGKENYEALIDRHGQFVRWRTASRCSCVKKNTFQPDIHCKKCGGRGFEYSVQRKAIRNQIVMFRDDGNILEVDAEFEDCILIKVFDTKGIEYKSEKNGCFITVNGEIRKGEYLTVLMMQNLVKKIDRAECESLGYGYYRIKGLRKRRNGIDGIFYDVPCDIIKIETVRDSQGNVFHVKELRQDTFYIEPEISFNDDLEEVEIPIEDPVTIENIEYVEPYVFALLNQNLSKADAAAMVESTGDAICSFPYRYNVADNDVITALSGTFIKKEVINRIKNEFDTLGAFFVDEIVELFTDKRQFVQNVDFLLLGANRIKWICEDAPVPGETYSITYKVFPTYTVVKEIPQLRTSEDQHMPKKVVVKLYNSYAEMAKINRQ